MKKNILVPIIIIIIAIIVITVFFTTKNKKQASREYEIETITEYKYFVSKENDKYGVINAKGESIINANYEEVKIPNPGKAIFVCYEDEEKVKILNEKEEELFTEYDKVEPLRLTNVASDLMYEKSTLRYKENDMYGIINFEGKQLTKAIYEEIESLPLKEGELLVKQDGKYGVININGVLLVDIKYDTIESDQFYEEKVGYKNSGYIVSEITNEGYRYGYVNKEGKEILPTQYNDLFRVLGVNGKDTYIICAENGKYGLIRNDKKIVENEYQSLSYVESNNTFLALKGKKYGIISIDGQIVIPVEYIQTDITGEYIYATSENGTVKIFDSKGKEANIDENVAIVNVKDTEYKIHIETTAEKTIYNIYKNNEKLTNDEYTYIEYLYDNYFIASNEMGRLGIIDINNQIKVEFENDSIQKIGSTTMIEVIKDNIVQIYSKNLEKISELEDGIIEDKKDYLKLYNEDETKYILNGKEVANTEVFKDNKIFAQKSGSKWGFVDINGNNVVDYRFDRVTEVNKYGYAGIKKDDKWGVIDEEGTIILQPEYEIDEINPTFIGKYYQVIFGNGEIYYTK